MAGDRRTLGHRTALYHRTVLGLSALYNVCFGAWAVFAPGGFFDVFDLEPPRYPGIWSCLGMVVGVYGLAYGYAAFRLELARPFVALGLLGKVLGPAGWVLAVRSGELPIRTFPLIVFNDLVWWLPFALILLEGTRAGERLRASSPYVCSVLNALATAAMALWLAPGTEAEPDSSRRAAYIAANPIAWRAGWGLWIAAASSLVAFYAWWGARLPAAGWVWGAFLAAICGYACDMLAEALYIGWLPERLGEVGALGTLLTGCFANGLYTAAGAALTLRTPGLPPWLRAWAWATWAAGVALTAGTAAGSVTAMIASTAIVMPLFCPLPIFIARALRRA